MNTKHETHHDDRPSILVVDDAEEDIQLLSMMLSKERYQTAYATDGSQALSLVNQLQPDLILLDIMMPGLSGLEVCRQLKASTDTRDIPVIFLSAKTASDDIVNGFRAGAVDYVTKPCNAEELLARVDAHLELKKSRETLRQYSEELKGLSQAADAALTAKNEFIAGISHEMRTPLNAILGMAELLGESFLDDEQKRYVQTLQNSGEDLNLLISDILDFSKMEAGQMALAQVKLNLQEIIDELFKIHAPAARAKQLDFSCFVEPLTPIHLIGDPARLRQILANLINNAVKFTEKGKIRLEVALEETAAEDEDDSMVGILFSVRDSGIGIALDMQERIFERFIQADPSNTRKYHGTGLGLTISERLSKMMGGRIWVKSDPGKGSIFYFTAKFMIAKAPEPESQQRPIAMKNLRILEVDDSEESRFVVEAYLKNGPYDIDIADNGKDAVEKAIAGNYDVILMDIQMPVMDGFEATRAIRAWEADHNKEPKPIIALTAHVLPEDQQTCFDAGCSAFLAKPVKKGVLLQAIQKHTRNAERPSPGKKTRRGVRFVTHGDTDVADMIPWYLGKLNEYAMSIRKALPQGDFDTIREIGYRMKGSGTSYGFEAISEMGRSIEQHAIDKSVSGIKRSVEELTDYLDRIEITDPLE